MRPLTSIGRNTRTDWKVSRLYKLARRTLVASIVCLSVSFINVFFVVLSHGHQRGLICLTMCTVDVTVKYSSTKNMIKKLIFIYRLMLSLSTGYYFFLDNHNNNPSNYPVSYLGYYKWSFWIRT